MKVSLDSTWFSEQDKYSPNTGDEVTVNLSINLSGEDFTTDVDSHVSDALEFEPILRYVEFIIIRKQTCDVSVAPLRNMTDVLHGVTSYVFAKKKYLTRMTTKDNLYNMIEDDMEKSHAKLPAYKIDKDVEKDSGSRQCTLVY